jgi:hypothetical protein
MEWLHGIALHLAMEFIVYRTYLIMHENIQNYPRFSVGRLSSPRTSNAVTRVESAVVARLDGNLEGECCQCYDVSSTRL